LTDFELIWKNLEKKSKENRKKQCLTEFLKNDTFLKSSEAYSLKSERKLAKTPSTKVIDLMFL